MEIKLKLTSDSIYDKTFTPVKTGYDCKEVDEYLDVVMSDYKLVEENLESYSKLKKQYQNLQDRVTKLEAENSLLKENSKDDSVQSTSTNNLELLKRISKLEKALKGAGIDPIKVR